MNVISIDTRRNAGLRCATTCIVFAFAQMAIISAGVTLEACEAETWG